MPDRILREGILESDAVNMLTWPAEVFYRRLFSAVDDFGNYHGKPELLLAKLYPLKLDRVSIADVDKWLTECVGAGLISKYEVQGKAYVSIEKFDQKGLKRKVSKFPNKVLNAQVAEDVRLKRREEKRREIEVESEVDIEIEYERPRFFLKRVNEIALEQLAMKSGIGPEFEKCIEQWSLAVEGSTFKYSANESDDYRRLFAQFTKWLNTWISNNQSKNSKPDGSKTGSGRRTGHDIGEIESLADRILTGDYRDNNGAGA